MVLLTGMERTLMYRYRRICDRAAKMYLKLRLRKQVMIAVDEADAIIFMVDAHTGMTDLDDSMAHISGKAPNPFF
jgi:predicted GTPase